MSIGGAFFCRDREFHNVEYTDAIQKVVSSLVAIDEFKGRTVLKTYREVFETPYIQATGEYYRMEASRLVNETTCSSYVEKVWLSSCPMPYTSVFRGFCNKR